MLPQQASTERCCDHSCTAVAALQIAEKMIEAQETEKQINTAREAYRGVAARGAMLFFLLQASGLGWVCEGALGCLTPAAHFLWHTTHPLLQSLSKIHANYSFSLNAFLVSLYSAVASCTLTTTTNPAGLTCAARPLQFTQPQCYHAISILPSTRLCPYSGCVLSWHRSRSRWPP